MKKLLIAVLALALVAAFCVPAIAGTHVGGIIFTTLMWDDRDADKMDLEANGYTTTAARQANTGMTGNTMMHLYNSAASRLYVRWDNEDKVGLHFELGTHFGLGPGQEAVYMRQYYGWWQVNPGFRLLLGMTTSPFSPLNASALAYFQLITDGAGNGVEANAISAGYGNIYVERSVQIRGEWDFGPHFIHVALADYDNNAGNAAAGSWSQLAGTGLRARANGGVVAEDTMLPRLDLAGKIQAGPVAIYPGFSYLKRTFEMLQAGDEDSMTIWAGSLGAKFAIGPVTVTAEGNIGKNWFESGLIDGVSNDAAVLASPMYLAAPGAVNRQFYDTDCWGWFIDLEFNLGMVKPNIYYGVQMAENSDYPGDLSDWAYKNWNIGFRIPFHLAKGLQIAPEFVYADNGSEAVNTGAVRQQRDWGTMTRYGVMFQITF